jgi:oligopeptide/dipeptide ABC transporter ATP-binding protein
VEKVLEVESLTVTAHKKKQYVHLVKDVSFSVYKNETLALVGESGCGKTTTAHTILGLNRFKRNFSSNGKILFDAINLVDLDEKTFRTMRGSKISIVFQDPQTSLNPVFSIGSQLAEVFALHGLEESESIVYDALEKVGLASITHPFDTYPHELSGGMKQRVLIAIALCMRPKLLLADEPTSALDVSVQKEILELLKTYQMHHDMATLIITHDFSVVEKMADRVLVMYRGQIVEEGTKDEIFTNPLHPYTQALMHARLTKEKQKKILDVGQKNGTKFQEAVSGCPFYERCPHRMEACKNTQVRFLQKSPTHKVRCLLYEENT